jgi:hypothetical protein
VMFFIGLPSMMTLVSPDVSDMEGLADNAQAEIPRALNLGILEGSGTDSLEDFSGFLQDKMAERNIELSLIWVYTEPSAGGTDLTVGNFMGSSEDVTVSLDGEEKSFTLSDGSTRTESFSASTSPLDLTFEFGSSGKTLTIERNKHNLYCYMTLIRGNEVIVKEIIG